MLVQSAIHFALDYLIQSACRYFEVSISSNKVRGRNNSQNRLYRNCATGCCTIRRLELLQNLQQLSFFLETLVIDTRKGCIRVLSPQPL